MARRWTDQGSFESWGTITKIVVASVLAVLVEHFSSSGLGLWLPAFAIVRTTRPAGALPEPKIAHATVVHVQNADTM